MRESHLSSTIKNFRKTGETGVGFELRMLEHHMIFHYTKRYFNTFHILNLTEEQKELRWSETFVPFIGEMITKK